MAALRGALFDAVTPEDIAAVVEALIREARDGDVAAARELLDRVVGKAEAIDLMERLTALEDLLVSVQEAMSGSGRGEAG